MNTLALPDSDLELYQQGRACPIWRGYYSIDLVTGQVKVRGEPTKFIFESAWTQLNYVNDRMPRILGNMLAHAGKRWKDEYAELIMQQSGKYFTWAQYKSTYDRIPEWVQEKHPDAKHTYCRIVAALPPKQQDAVLTRVEAGEFNESTGDKDKTTKEQRVRRIRNMLLREPPPKPPVPMICPICGGNGLSREALHKVECPHAGCGAHGDELLERFTEALAAMREFALYGSLDGIIEFVRPYKNGWTEEAD